MRQVVIASRTSKKQSSEVVVGRTQTQQRRFAAVFAESRLFYSGFSASKNIRTAKHPISLVRKGVPCVRRTTGSHARAATAGIVSHREHCRFYAKTFARIELAQPCADGMDLMTCPDFSAEQPYGPAEMPLCPGRWAPEGDCPRCDYETYNMRRRRMMAITKSGLRWGVGPARRDVPGLEFVWCCAVM